MKRSEAIKTILSSYYFQYGKHVNKKVIKKVEKLISTLEKEENRLAKEQEK